jgi:cytochrome c peroxidase
VVEHVRAAPYARALRDLYGAKALDDVDVGFAAITDALAAYERTPELSPFSSKYDRYIAGTTTLSAAEMHGLTVFQRACASCHPPPLFTDFSYANLGIPRYPNNMFYASNPTYVDHGLAKTTGDPAQDGKFRVPTLRDIMRTAPYSHNGYFENVPYMIEFLNTRDIGSAQVSTCSRAPGSASACPWPSAEIPATVDARVGHLGLTPQEMTDLGAFLATLSDE